MRRPSPIIVSACIAFVFAVLGTPASADETTPPPPTTSPPTTTEPLPPPGPKLIQPGVTIGGLLVGGLTGPEARALVEERFDRPVTLVVSPGHKIRVEPSELGAAAHFLKAVKTAVRVRTPGFAVPLGVDVKQSKLERYLADLATRTDPSTRPSRCSTSGPSPASRSRVSGSSRSSPPSVSRSRSGSTSGRRSRSRTRRSAPRSRRTTSAR